jgi:hypothetical protein
VIAEEERLELDIANLERAVSQMVAEESYPRERETEIRKLQADINDLRKSQASRRRVSVEKLRSIIDRVLPKGG